MRWRLRHFRREHYRWGWATVSDGAGGGMHGTARHGSEPSMEGRQRGTRGAQGTGGKQDTRGPRGGERRGVFGRRRTAEGGTRAGPGAGHGGATGGTRAGEPGQGRRRGGRRRRWRGSGRWGDGNAASDERGHHAETGLLGEFSGLLGERGRPAPDGTIGRSGAWNWRHGSLLSVFPGRFQVASPGAGTSTVQCGRGTDQAARARGAQRDTDQARGAGGHAHHAARVGLQRGHFKRGSGGAAGGAWRGAGGVGREDVQHTAHRRGGAGVSDYCPGQGRTDALSSHRG